MPDLYRTIRRWHSRVGIALAPLLLIVALSGGILSFKPQLERLFYASSMFVQPGNARVPYQTLRNAAERELPGCVIHQLMTFSDPSRAVVFTGSTGGEDECQVYADPYTGRILAVHPRGSFFDRVFRLHRTLLAGHTGELILEFMISWAIVLVVMGLYLWFPRGAASARGIFWPRLGASRGVMLRDLHAVAGFYLSWLAAVMFLTSLLFTSVFGHAYLALLDKTGSMPKSFLAPLPSSARNGRPQVPVDDVIAAALRAGIYEEMRVRFPQSEAAAYYILAGSDASPRTRGVMLIDQYSGATLDVYRWPEFSLGLKVLLSGLPVHTGLIGGVPTQALALLACILVIWSSVTGPLLWWRQRGLGASNLPYRERRLPKAPLVIAMLLPMVGISVAAIWLGAAMWNLARFLRR